MVNPNILEKKPISLAELKTEINAIKKRDGELNFRAARVEEYVNDFASLSSKKAKELFKAIKELGVPRLKDEAIVKIVDLLPGSVEELKSVLQGFNLSINNENYNKIQSLVNQYLE